MAGVSDIKVILASRQGLPGRQGDVGATGEVSRAELLRAAVVPARVGEMVNMVISPQDDSIVGDSTLIMHRDEVPPNELGFAMINFREVDGVKYDPEEADPSKRWKIYATGYYANTESRIFCKFSPTGEPGSWGAIQRCYLMNVGVDEQAQDPSIMCRFSKTNQVYRDAQGRMILFTEERKVAPAGLHSYFSTDGVNWTRTHAGKAVDYGAPGEWDANLAGSPCAIWDDVFSTGQPGGGRVIVFYEGRVAQDVDDACGIAFGPTPDALTKYANNPVWHPDQDPMSKGLAKPSIVVDAVAFVSGGWPLEATLWADRIMLMAHSGNQAGMTWRGYTKKLNPLTWNKDDPLTGGGDIRSIPGAGPMDPAKGEFLFDATSPYHIIAPGYNLRDVRRFPLVKRLPDVIKDVPQIVERIGRLAPLRNTAVNTVMWQLAPPAGFTRQATKVRVGAWGTILQNTGADRTMRFQLRAGGAVFDSGGGVNLRSLPSSVDRRSWQAWLEITFSPLLTAWNYVGQLIVTEPHATGTIAKPAYAPFTLSNSGEATFPFNVNTSFELQVQLGLASNDFEFLVIDGDVRQIGDSNL